MFQRLKFKAMKQSSSVAGARRKKRVPFWQRPDRNWPAHLDPSQWVRHNEYGFVKRKSGIVPVDFQIVDKRRPALIDAVQAQEEWRKRMAQTKSLSEERAVYTEGNLVGDEFRFWVGVKNPDSNLARCKGCGHTVLGKQQRKQHMDERGCTQLLVNAYKLLSLDKKCVVCDKDTFGNTKWGVALCTDLNCLRVWMFELKKRLPALDAAIALTLPKIRESLPPYWKTMRQG